MTKSGFTLLETLLAVAILSIGVIGVLKVCAQGQTALADSRTATSLSLLAASKWAEIEAAGPIKWKEKGGPFPSPNDEYMWEVAIRTPEELEAARKVVLVVSRRDRPDKKIILEGYFVVPWELGPESLGKLPS